MHNNKKTGSMKHFSLAALSLAAVLSAGCGVSGALAEADKETQELVEADIQNHEIYINIDTIHPLKGSPIHTADGYYIQVKDGKANSYLPFFGESYVATFGGTDGPEITYKDCPVDVEESVNSKGKHTWTFTGKAGDGEVTTRIEFFTSGSATVTCSSSRRTAMTYLGTVTEAPHKKGQD